MNYSVHPFSYWTRRPWGLRLDAIEATRRGEQAWEKAEDILHNDGVLIITGCTFIVGVHGGAETHVLSLTSDDSGGGTASQIHTKIGFPINSTWHTHLDWVPFCAAQRTAWLREMESNPKGGTREAVEKILGWAPSKKEAA